jgi:hypothetical protein
MATEDKGPWWVVGVQIHAAMGGYRREAFLAEHSEQATDACLGFLRSVPAAAEVDLVPLIEHLGEQIRTHARHLCDQAELNSDQAGRLMAASRQGYDRFVEAFGAEVRAGRGRPGAGLLHGIEAALAAGGRSDAFLNRDGIRPAPELGLLPPSPWSEAVASPPRAGHTRR